VDKATWTPIALCLLVLRPPSVGAQSASDHVAMGVAADEAHDPKTALRHYEAALEQDSANYEANWRAALALLDVGEMTAPAGKSRTSDSLYRVAERYAKRAVAADPSGADGHFAFAASLGRLALDMGKKERIRRAELIRRETLRTIELNPRHDGAYHILGRWNAEIMGLSGFSRFFAKTFLGGGVFGRASWSRAIANMEKAVELDPGRIYHRLELARIYVERKRIKDAQSQLRAVDSLPNREVMDSVYKRQGAELARRLARR
jgi:tetratricopeptide (TPR) repeat protein